ncbi:MAG: hypothetical protein ACLFO2_04450 [Candidatus Woesearchaeota archaeon]
MRSRVGQVTLFVIIGLVLILIVALFLFVRRTEQQVDPAGQTITHDFDAIKASYEREAASCLREEGKRVLKEIYSHGGFYEPKQQGKVGFPENPTLGNSLPLTEEFLVPYWVEQRSPAGCLHDCEFSIGIPPLKKGSGGRLPSIESQLEKGVEENVGPCLDRMSFSDDYLVEPAEEFSVEAIIGEGRITYELHRNVSFTYTSTGANTSVKEVSALQEAPAKELYESTKDVVEFLVLMNKSDTIHHAVKQVIEAYSMGEDPEIPPMYGGTKFETNNQDRWMYPDVKEFLERRLADNLPLIQVGNTADRNIVMTDNQFSQAVYNAPGVFRPDVLFDNPSYASGVAYSFNYDSEWPVDLKIGPGNGYVLEPSGMTIGLELLFSIGFYEYYFDYDVVVPLLLMAEDSDAFDGEGLSMLVGVEAGLVQNEPMLYSDPSLGNDSVGQNLFSMESQRMDGNITINVTDVLTGDPVEDVGFTYSCGSASTHASDRTGSDGIAVTRLPFCIDGLLTGEKEGYYIDPQDIDVLDDDPQQVSVEAYPHKEFELELRGLPLFKKMPADVMYGDDGLKKSFEEEVVELEEYGIDPRSGIWEVGTQREALRPDDLLTIIFTRHTAPGEPERVEMVVANYTNADTFSVPLAKGSYDVEAFLVTRLGEGRQREKVLIPEDEVTWGEGWFDGPEGSETIPAVEFNDSIYRGGIRLTGSNSLEVGVEEYHEDSLVLNYVSIRLDDLEKHADLGVLGQVEGYTDMYRDRLEPRFGEEEPSAQPAE